MTFQSSIAELIAPAGEACLLRPRASAGVSPREHGLGGDRPRTGAKRRARASGGRTNGELASSVATIDGSPALSFAYLRDDLGRIAHSFSKCYR
jgi:hypothetical protein